MRRFDGLNIELTRGDTLQFKVTFSGRELPEGTKALFTVKKSPRSDTPVIEKTISIANNIVYVGVSSADSNIPPRTYFWDMRVLIPNADGGYEVKTPMEYAAFTILEVIGDA